MPHSGGGWNLISSFSNADSANWMQSSGSWWYHRTSSYGSVTSTSNNYDMISPAFWLVITRSVHSSNTALLYTSSCASGRSFRSFITSYGNFRHSSVWNSDAVEVVTSAAIVAATHPQWASVRCTAAAIFKAVVACHSGVTGAMVTVPWWWLVEEMIHAAEQIMELVSLSLVTLGLDTTRTVATGTLVMIVPLLLVTPLICGLNSLACCNY